MPVTSRQSVVCLVPLPPPITGAALASETAINFMQEQHEVAVIPYQRGNLISGKFSPRQAGRIISCGLRLLMLRLRRKFDHAYLVVSSSFWGNMRDLLFMVLMGKRLRERLVVHLHGANIDTYLKGAPGWVQRLNRALYKDAKAAIVLGETFEDIFDGYVPRERVRIVKNYFDPHLLISEEELERKFAPGEKVHFLYLSNLIKAKGYEKLLDAFLSLDEKVSGRAVLHFAGTIYSPVEKAAFLRKIAGRPNIIYHGVVHGEQKQRLLWQCHVFCLPTVYLFEGQPISILEAYAAGCVVLTTENGGIRDVFADGKNGYFVDKEMMVKEEYLARFLEIFIVNIGKYRAMAEHNRSEAVAKYQRQIYNRNIEQIIFID